jgi:Flp pilus assembly protein TadD
MPLVVVVAGLLAYSNSFTGPFIFDDVRWIQENPTIRHLWPIWDVLWPTSSLVNARPVVNLSLAVNYALGGFNVWGYHALNLTVHILAGLTLLGVVRRTLVQPALRERFGAVANELALVVAILWTVHPLQTESVTYVIQRTESLMGLFYLLTLYCFIRGVASSRPRLWYGLCVGACALGMASKEVMVSAPLMVLLYDRAFVSGSFREAARRRWPLYLGLLATWMLEGLMVVAAGTFAHTSVMVQRAWGITRWEYLLTEPGVILHYLQLAAWPYPLCFDYYGSPLAGTGLNFLLPTLVIAILLGATVWLCKTNSACGFVGAWFFLILAPSSSIIPLDSPAYEHRMYLSLAAVVVLGVTEMHALFGRRTLAVAVLLAIVLGVVTWRRNQDFRSNVAIWQDTVAKCPWNPRAQLYLGNALTQPGTLPEAVEHLEQAVRLKPEYAVAHCNLGIALAQSGRVEEAIGHFEQALRLMPDYPEAHCNLGVALGRVGRMPEAIEHFEQAIRLTPEYAEAHCNLGVTLGQVGQIPEAIGQLEQAIRLKPDYPEAHYNLGVALGRVGRMPEAIGHFEQALQLKPGYADAQKALARLQARQ